MVLPEVSMVTRWLERSSFYLGTQALCIELFKIIGHLMTKNGTEKKLFEDSQLSDHTILGQNSEQILVLNLFLPFIVHSHLLVFCSLFIALFINMICWFSF